MSLDSRPTSPRRPSPVRGAATVFSDYFSILGARIGSALLSLVSIVLTTRILEPRGYGIVAYLAVLANLVFTVTSAWTSTAVSRFGREELERTGTMTTVTWARVAVSAPLLLIAFGVVVGLKTQDALPREFTWTFVWLALATGTFLIASEHMVYLLEARGRIKLSAAGVLMNQALVVGALAFIFVSGIGQSPVVVVVISLAASVMLTVAFVGFAWRSGVWPPRWDSDVTRKVVVFSAPLIAFTFSQYVIRSVDLIVIRAYGTLDDVGVYAVAYRGYSVLQGMAAASGPVLTPLFVSLRMADREGAIRLYIERVLPQLLFIASILTGLAAPIVVVAVPFVFGPEFDGATDPLLVLLVANCLFFTANLAASVLVLHSRTRTIAIVNLGAAAINVSLDLLLVGVLDVGIVGAAIATLAALVLVCASYVIVAMRCVDSTTPTNPVLAAPMIVGTGASMLSHGLGMAGLAILGTAFTAAVVQRTTHPFRQDDGRLVERLDMPTSLKRLVLRALKLMAR